MAKLKIRIANDKGGCAGGGYNSYDTHRFGLLGNPSGSTDGGAFTVHGPGVGRDSTVMEAGVNVQWSPTVSAYLNYDAVVNDAYQSHNITGGMSFSF